VTAKEQREPSNLDAEKAVLGGCLIDPDAIAPVAGVLRAEDFYDDSCRWAWEAVLSLYRAGEPVDQLTVMDRMASAGTLDAAGGLGFLVGLTAEVPTSVHTNHYARVVERAATRRRLIRAAERITVQAFDESSDLGEVENEAAKLVLEARSRQHQKARPVSELVSAYYDRLEMMMNNGKVPGLPTGFADVDKILCGMQRSDFVVLAARPAMGKTSLALGIARNAAMRFGARTVFFSLEMDRDQVIQRLVSVESAIPVNSLKQGKVLEAEFPAFLSASDAIQRLPIWVDDTPDAGAMDLRSKCLEVEAEAGGLDLVVVDYLQLMRGEKRQSPYERVSDNARSLKTLAKDLKVPVLCLSQLNRSCEARLNKRPMLSDLRESGIIEEVANQVAFIYRDEVYNPDTTETPNVAEIIVAKNRDGAIGSASLLFEKALTRFRDAEIRVVDAEWL